MNSALSREDILLAFSVEPIQDKKTLDRYINKYPNYKVELIELSIDLLVTEEMEEITNNRISTGAKDSWSYFQSLVENNKNKIPLETKNLFENIDKKQFKELSNKLDITTLLFSRIRDKSIEITTIPQLFIKQLTDALKIDAILLNTYLNTQHIIDPSENFKSDKKPEASEKISFQEAIEISHLSDSQKDKLKKLLD